MDTQELSAFLEKNPDAAARVGARMAYLFNKKPMPKTDKKRFDTAFGSKTHEGLGKIAARVLVEALCELPDGE